MIIMNALGQHVAVLSAACASGAAQPTGGQVSVLAS